METPIPITDEQAKAIQELAKAGGQAIELIQTAGGYFARVLGTVPDDLVGVLGGDALRVRRVENMLKHIQKAQERLKARGTEETSPPPLPLLQPILTGAAEEEREELVDLWSRLLAAAMDSARVGRVRQGFIDVVKRLDPLDALVLNSINPPVPHLQPSPQVFISHQLGRSLDETEVSLMHLIELNILRETMTRAGESISGINRVDFTVFGRELVRILRD